MYESTSNTNSADQQVRIENFIGYTKVPVGATPPLTIHGVHQKKRVKAPLATTEATLVASCSRGVKVFEVCGGISARAYEEQISRSPVFVLSSTKLTLEFADWIEEHFTELKKIAESTTNHGKLIKIQPYIFARSVHLEFTYTTSDAAGQNIVTIATQKVCDELLTNKTLNSRFVFEKSYVEGNTTAEKKLSLMRSFTTRGVKVRSWGIVNKDACLKYLNVHPRDIYRLYIEAMQSSIRTSTLGMNINSTNILAAMYLSCGQDAGSIAESSWSQLSMDIDDDDNLHMSLYFPSLLVGTVGGGTQYSDQSKHLKMLDCLGVDRKMAFAETVASFCLALELSTIAAVSNNTFAKAHKTLARL
ncbi:hypothetical protein K7432_003700 [Basidiobolus ranarum]|uniref:hydroxymethylglutaryl-CoA reductase (NADPH) n=1 Tax=Basidiobolus ranarum TaxID=34480 RepID=A0ABR2WZE1_9FUNG